MQYGCCTTMEWYDVLAAMGYDFIELAGREVALWDDEETDRVARRIADGTVRCCGLNAFCPPSLAIAGPGFDPGKTEQYAKLLCRKGAALGIHAIGVGCGGSRTLPQGYDREAAWRQARMFLTIFAQEAQRYGQTVLWETLNATECNFGICFAEDAQRIADFCLPNLGVLCDLYHLFMNGETVEDLKAGFGQIRHLHISHRVGAERRYITKESVPVYKELLDAVLELGYDGIISVEAMDGEVSRGACESIRTLKQMTGDWRCSDARSKAAGCKHPELVSPGG